MTAFDYYAAIRLLNSLQSNAATLAALRKQPARYQNSTAIPEMLAYARRVGITQQQLKQLNIIHVTGTKGKGSTCAMAEQLLLRSHLAHESRWNKPLKVGTYTSPHLVHVRERIRLNGAPIEEELFVRHFFECWQRLEATRHEAKDYAEMPSYFRFMTLLAYYTFIVEKVDVACIEVGIGGLHDATNIVEEPRVCAIASLGYDHQALLGNTLAEIAFQKAGIYKRNSWALSVVQPDDAIPVIEECAKALEVPLIFVQAPPLEQHLNLPLGIGGSHQYSNAALAIQAVRLWLNWEENKLPKNQFSVQKYTLDVSSVQPWERDALKATKWAGRSHIFAIPGTSWQLYLDGAHTIESVTACAEWFAKAQRPQIPKVLVFNCTSDRDPKILMAPLKTLDFEHVFICANCVDETAESSDLANLMIDRDVDEIRRAKMPDAWSENGQYLTPKLMPSVRALRSELENIYSIEQPLDILVTGSLHLVGVVMTAYEVPV